MHLIQRVSQLLQTRAEVQRDQLSDAVSVAIDDVLRGAAAVVAVQRGGALQADGEVAGLTEEPKLLARVEGAEDRAAEATTRLELLQELDRVGRCALLPPGSGERAQKKKNQCINNDYSNNIMTTTNNNNTLCFASRLKQPHTKHQTLFE